MFICFVKAKIVNNEYSNIYESNISWLHANLHVCTHADADKCFLKLALKRRKAYDEGQKQYNLHGLNPMQLQPLTKLVCVQKSRWGKLTRTRTNSGPQS